VEAAAPHIGQLSVSASIDGKSFSRLRGNVNAIFEYSPLRTNPEFILPTSHRWTDDYRNKAGIITPGDKWWRDGAASTFRIAGAADDQCKKKTNNLWA
jgi:hypothetical protein